MANITQTTMAEEVRSGHSACRRRGEQDPELSGIELGDLLGEEDGGGECQCG
jgi:hypothetical protein